MHSYVKYQDGRGRIDGGQYSAESQWRLVEGLANEASVSIESVTKPGFYLRHRDGLLEISTISTAVDQQDATFYVK